MLCVVLCVVQAYVQCAVSKCWTPSFTNKAMYDMEKITLFYLVLCYSLVSVSVAYLVSMPMS